MAPLPMFTVHRLVNLKGSYSYSCWSQKRGWSSLFHAILKTYLKSTNIACMSAMHVMTRFLIWWFPQICEALEFVRSFPVVDPTNSNFGGNYLTSRIKMKIGEQHY